MKHTQGPWELQRWTSDDKDLINTGSEYFIGNDHHDICYMARNKIDGVDQSHYDAKLIASAPDLLEALENIENDDGSIPKAIWDMRNAAIAKAKGESK